VDIPPIRPANSFHVAINNDPNRAAEMPPGALVFALLHRNMTAGAISKKFPLTPTFSLTLS
jgi:hypothetical protein